MSYRMEKGELTSVTESISSSVRTDRAREWGTSQVQWLGNLSWKTDCTKKKNFKGFALFLRLKFFKTALKCDLRQWSSHH
jgi:hypothetical protein